MMDDGYLKQMPLSEIAIDTPDAFVDGPFGSNLKSAEYTDEGVRLIQLQNIGSGEWLDFSKKFVSTRKLVNLSRHAVRPGDIAIAKMAEPVARACIVPAVADNFMVVADCIKLRVNETKSDPRFIVELLNSYPFRNQAERKSIGTTRIRINLSILKDLAIAIPSVSAQQRIAEILVNVNEAIRMTERLTAKLELAKQGLLRDLLTRGVDSSGQLRDPQRGSDTFVETPLGLLPSSWSVQAVDALLSEVKPAMRSGPFGSALLKSELVQEGVPMLGIDNVQLEHFVQNYSRFVSQEKYRELARYAVRPKDVMVTIMGTVGRCCVVPDDIGQALSSKHVWTLTFDSRRYLPELACAQINYSDWVLRHFASDAQGGIMSAIRSDTLRTTLLPVPPIGEQHRIWEILQTVQTRIDTARRETSKLRLLKQGLTDDLLTGRVKVQGSV